MLAIRDLCKSFGQTRAVNGLSLEIREGEIFGLLGPNGAGKTTTLHIIMGLIEPDSGAVEMVGAGSSRDRAWRGRIGMAPQALALYEDLTGRENLCFFGRLQNLGGARLKERASKALEFAGLSDRGDDRVKAYSGGMRRRLNLAVATMHDPPILLLDEPTAGVDPQSRNALFENIEALRREGRTIVYTTHYMEEAQRLCDRVGIIDHGRLLALDTVNGLIEAHGGESVLVVDSRDQELRIHTADPLAELNRLHDEGTVGAFRMERPDLEQVFLNLTGRQLRD